MDRYEEQSFRGIDRRLPELPLDDATSLDPCDWNAFRELCVSQLDELIDHLSGSAERPVWRPVPAEVKESLCEPLPIQSQGARQVCGEIDRLILPYTLGNTNPRFFGWVHGAGTSGGMLAELYAAAMNANLGGRDHAPVYVERTVIEWCKQIFAFPQSATGLLLSGTSMANLVALAVARNHHCSTDIRERGVASAPNTLVGYTSVEAHCSVAKAFEFLGLGRENLRRIPTNRDFQIDLSALQQAVSADRAEGLQPFCIVGTAGTVNSGANDDLDGLSSFAKREDLWFHIDGAFGAFAILSDECRPKLRGIERADSLAFDFHKWLHVSYDAGCVLIRDGQAHHDTFSTKANYLCNGRGAAAGAPWYCEFGPELSRSFRALKVWFTLKEHGLERLGAKITDNCRQARFLRELIDGHRQLELLAPVSLNIVCFRYVVPGLSDADLDRLNSELVIVLHESGIAVPSTTRVHGRLAIRVNITNHRTRASDLQSLINAIDELAPTVLGRIAPERPKRIAQSELLAAKVIETVTSRTELKPLLTGVTLTHDRKLELPFVVDRDGTIRLGADAIANPTKCVEFLRHALELVALQKLAPDSSALTAATLAFFACRTAAISSSLAGDQEEVPDWPAETKASVGSLRRLLPLRGIDAAVADELTPAEWETVNTRLRESQPLAGPTEFLLTTGGDARLNIDPQTEMSRYGCRRKPVEELSSFGSCTATTVTRRNFAAAERTRQRLIAAAIRDEFAEQFTECTNSLKQKILEFTGADSLPGTQVLLCSSGTDAELYAVGLAAELTREKLTSIVIAPQETGSGVPDAAAGRHFSTRTPQGCSVTQRAQIDGLAGEAIEVMTIAARDSVGNLRQLSEIGQEAEQTVEAAVRQGMCLLHVLDTSKTGWGAPSLSLVRKLVTRHADRLLIIVDACQMRLNRNELRRYLEEGFLVQVTGSKSFGGPPFSGALLVPQSLASRFAQLDQLPGGLLDYALRAEWPAEWKITRTRLRPSYNVGLMLRWTAAIGEMQSFQEVPRHLKTTILRELAGCVQAALKETEIVVPMVPCVRRHSSRATSSDWDEVPTIFPFRVRHHDERLGGAFLNHEQMKKLHHRLNVDLAMIPETQAAERKRSLASLLCHIGQPVELCRTPGNPVSVLRFCTGAHIVSRIAFDSFLGSCIEERLERERIRIQRVFEKIRLIVEHWETIDRFESGCDLNPVQISPALESVC